MFDTGKTQIDIDVEQERADAASRLIEIDKESIRAIRAILSSEAPLQEEDVDKLKDLENEAKIKRDKLKAV